ncbi:MAG TPA: PKD-like domain-containing protein [Chryseosolibacter sp.]|nr:PKD-like domain-containing protein [Chryseosolibacter sp.]
MKALILTLTFSAISFFAFGQEPTIQASGISFSSVTQTSVTITWTIGNGSSRLVVGNQDSAPPAPGDGAVHSANAAWGLGDAVGGSSYAVYNGAGNSVTVTGLSPNTMYYFQIFEFNNVGSPNYLTSTSGNNPSNVTTLACETANAGSDAPFCFGSSIFLSASPIAVGTGTWTILSGGTGTFNNMNDPATQFTPDAPGNFTLEWSVTDACGTTTDQVTITVDPVPTINAGSDVNVCEGTIIPLSATPLQGAEIGNWNVVPADGAFFDNTSNPSTNFHGNPGTLSYTLTWQVSSICGGFNDDLTVTFDPLPDIADAGIDQNVCGPSAFLSANTPLSGTGIWSVFSGTGGTFSPDNLDPNATFMGNEGEVYILEWTVSSGTCAPTNDQVSITFNFATVTPDAGTDQSACGNSIVLAALPPSNAEAGLWTANPSAGTSFSDASDPTATFFGVEGNVYTLTWNISNGSCSPQFDDVIITLDDMPDAGIGNSTGTCNDVSITLSNYLLGSPDPGGVWTQSSGPSVVIPSGPSADLTGAIAGVYVFDYTVDNLNSCPPAVSQITVTVEEQPDAGSDNTVSACNTDAAFDLFANLVGAPDAGGIWTLEPGAPQSVPVTGNTVDFTGALAGTYVFEYFILGVSCSDATAYVTVNVTETPTANAGADGEACESAGSFVVTGASALNYSSVSWSHSGTGSLSDGTTLTPTYFFGIGETGPVTLTLNALGNGTCTSVQDDLILTITQNPFVNAGTDFITCQGTGNYSIIDATASFYSSIVWSTSGTGTFTNPNSLNTDYTPDPAETGAIVLTLTATSTGSCSQVIDSKTLTIDPTGTVVNPGNQTLCNGSNTSPIVFSGTATTFSWANDNPSIGLAANGSGDITSFTAINGGAGNQIATIIVTPDNAGCQGTPEIFTITVEASPTIANAGVDIAQCNNSTFTLAGNAPSAGTGSWSVISGGATIVTPSSPTSQVTGVSPGVTSILRWTITNGSCTNSFDDVNLSNYADPAALAGADQTICGTGTTLGATNPSPGFGTWSIISGTGGSVANSPDPTSPFSGVAGETYVLRWSVTNGACTSNFDDVQITLEASPDVAAAGADQAVCSVSAVLSANNPSVGTGGWTVVSGTGGSFVSAANAGTTFNGNAGETYVLRWSIANTCGTQTDDVTITFESSPTSANAGTDQNICGTGTTLAGNSPTVGTGTWTIISGAGGNISNSPDPSSPFSGTAGVTYVLRWTIVNGTCAPSMDDVSIAFEQTPTTPVAGTDQTVCATSTPLSANTAISGTGSWSVISGTGGSFTDITNPSSDFNGTPGEVYTLRWTISNACGSNADDVIVTMEQSPTTANANVDQIVCGPTALAANNPSVGTASWSVISGDGLHSNLNVLDPASAFDGSIGQTYVLRWTISNGTCTPSTDDVSITFEQTPTTAVAGVDQTVCATSVGLGGNNATVGTGVWSIVSGTGGAFIDTTNPASIFNGNQGETYTLRWTIANSCSSTFDDVTITMEQSPTTAIAGTDQTVCSGIVLDGNAPATGTGAWSIVTGDGFGFIGTPSDRNSTFTGTSGQSYTLRWTITNGGTCPDSFDDVVINIEPVPTTPVAGGDQTICGTIVALGANVPTIGNGTWSIVSGTGGTFDNINDPLTNFTGSEGEVYTLRWTIDNACAVNFDDVIVTLQSLPTVSNAGVDMNVCTTTATLAANAPTEGTGSWTIISGAGGVFVDDTNPVTDFDGLENETYILRWTIDNGLCTPSTDDVMVYFEPAPTQAAAGADIEICDGIVTLAGNTPTTGSGAWFSATGGIFSDPLNPQSTFEADPGTYTLEWGITSGTCPPSVDEVMITINPVPDMFINNLAPEIASGGTTSILLGSSLPGAGFQYMANAPAEITGAGNGFENTIEQVLENSSGVDQVVTYDITPVSPEGCTGTLQTATVTVLGNVNLPTVSEADSLVLVSIYTATNGPSWLINTNWLTGKVNTWHGVTVNDFRVTDLQLSANNLSGNLPASIANMAELSILIIGGNALTGAVPDLPPVLTYIDLTNNNFTSFGTTGNALQTVSVTGNALTNLPDMTGSPLQVLEVGSNNLTFGDLEPYLGVATFTYSPQAEVEDPLDILVDVGSGRTFNSAIDGTSNSFSWYKDGTIIPGETGTSLTLSNIQTEDEGIYHYTATNSLLPDLILSRSAIEMKVSSLKRDSIALRTIYQATGGSNWSNDANWLSQPLATGNWFGVTITDNRVTALSLPGNNLTGEMPTALKDIGNLTSINLANNQLTRLPVLTSLTGLTSLNVSGNRLHFNSLEQNAGIAGINYSNQAAIGEEQTFKIPVGGSHILQANVGGTSNIYTWRRNGSTINVTSNRIDITSIGRHNMGIYDCEITNPLVPNLTLQRSTETVWAVTSISGTIFSSSEVSAAEGVIRLLKINASGKYDTTVVHELNGIGAYQFDEIILADYQLAAFVDTVAYPNALPTYYSEALYWEEADTIFLNGPVSGINITSQYLPTAEPQGEGVIRGFLEEPEDEGEGGRVKANKRVARAGTSVRRVEGSGREQEETLTLIAYIFTNDNGEFEFQNLEEGEYRLNIQYPGYPMDPNSFVTITVGTEFEQEQVVSAIVQEGQIVVRQLIVTGASPEGYEVGVYPNPTSEILRIDFPSSQSSRRYAIFDLNGKRVMSGFATGESEEIAVRSLSSGTYLLQILENGRIGKSVRFVIK